MCGDVAGTLGIFSPGVTRFLWGGAHTGRPCELDPLTPRWPLPAHTRRHEVAACSDGRSCLRARSTQHRGAGPQSRYRSQTLL